MLIELKVGNFLSFKDVVTLSMVAAADKEHRETNTIPVNDKLSLLKSAAIYGANASGKTNLIRAVSFMRGFVLTSSKESSTDEIPVEKFRLSTETGDAPSIFEVTFLIDGVRYRSGFQADKKKVHHEWLFYVPTTREATLFTRENNKIKIGTSFKEGRGLEEKTRPNALFLSVVDQFNGETAGKILKWFRDIFIISGISESKQEVLTVSKLEEEDYKNFTLKFLKIADLAIKEIRKTIIPLSKETPSVIMPGRIKFFIPGKKTGGVELQIKTIHQKYDRDNQPVSEENFDLFLDESAGTQALFAFSAPIYDALHNGKVLFIDELTSKLHPLLTRTLIEVFHRYNPAESGNSDTKRKGQLIFAGHDTNILSNQFFRRDQVWFTQKDEYGATDLYSLEEYRVRKGASFSKDYIMGKYGAIPFIGDIESLFCE